MQNLFFDLLFPFIGPYWFTVFFVDVEGVDNAVHACSNFSEMDIQPEFRNRPCHFVQKADRVRRIDIDDRIIRRVFKHDVYAYVGMEEWFRSPLPSPAS